MTILQESRDNSIHKWLIIAGRQISQQLDQQLAMIGLTASNYFYILKIHDNPGLTQKTLGETEFIDPSNVTRAVKQLIAQGLIERRPQPQDKRAYQLALTDKGTAIYPKIFQILDVEEKQLADAVADQDYDQQLFINALQKIGQLYSDTRR